MQVRRRSRRRRFMADAPSKEVASARIGEIREGLKLLADYL
jgi:hypothetical protein